MKRKEQEETVTQQKAMTKYDRKMEARKLQEQKNKRDDKIFKISVLVVCALLIIAIASSIVVSITRKYSTLNGTYVSVGSHDLTKLEYDYYFNSSFNSYVNAYSSFLGLIGLDVNEDLDKQPYSDTMTWKEMFDQSTISKITDTKVLLDDAAANGFEYDVTQDYEAELENIAADMETNGVTEVDYFKNLFGAYATKGNVASFMKNDILASAYYNQLLADNTPSAAEITAYYEENRTDWDRTDYRIFTVEGEAPEEATEEQLADAFKQVKETADAMAKRRQAGEDFEALCEEYAPEDQKENYTDTESEYSLKEGTYYASANTLFADWLYDDARKEGDITVVEDAENTKAYVVEFVSKYYSADDDTSIAEEISYDRTRTYMDSLAAGYTFDGKGKIQLIEEEAEAETE